MPHRRWRRARRLLILLLVLVAVFWGTGWIYERNAERIHAHINDVQPDGVLYKARERVLERGSKRIVVLVHGFGASPMTMLPIFDAFAERTDADLWAPLLDYHGRSLQRFAAFDAEAIRDDLAARLTQRIQGYDEVVVIAHSFGGAMLADLVADGAIPDTATVLLLAPAVDIRANTETTTLQLQAFRLWSAYCDIVAFGCTVPNPKGVDAQARADIYAQTIFFFIVPDAVLQLFDYADAIAPAVAGIDRPIDIVMARDDAEVSYAGTETLCAGLSTCRLYAFETGGHALMYGANSAALNTLFLRLADDPGSPTACDGLACAVAVPADTAAGPIPSVPRRHARAAHQETPRWP
ncbi:alpha/beta hydrolase [Amorphus coralli]|uniref:alpha/beta hydrolase n=1 Tax=Amorphus coralli TaxID=340680 RepID=UPI00035CE6B9|nr:alpha/beta fold hydrolase [Amorphus coralli]